MIYNKNVMKTRGKILLWTCSIIPVIATGLGGIAYSISQTNQSRTQMYLVDDLNEINGIDNFANFDFSLLKDNLGFEPSHKYTSHVNPDYPDDETQMFDYRNAITADFAYHINDGLPNFIKTSLLCYFLVVYVAYAFDSGLDKAYNFLNDTYIKDFHWKVLDFSKIKYVRHTSRQSLDQFSFSGKFELSFTANPYGSRTEEEALNIQIEIYDIPFSFCNLYTLDFVFLGVAYSYDFETSICHTKVYKNDSFDDESKTECMYLYSFPGTPWNDIFSDIDLLLME